MDKTYCSRCGNNGTAQQLGTKHETCGGTYGKKEDTDKYKREHKKRSHRNILGL